MPDKVTTLSKKDADISALGNFPLPEDRKPAVVRTDVDRGILTEAQARDAARGMGHIDARIDTPAESDPYVGNLAQQAVKLTQANVEGYTEPVTDDPRINGEAAARTLDDEVRANVEGTDTSGGITTAEERVADVDTSKDAEPGKEPAGNE